MMKLLKLQKDLIGVAWALSLFGFGTSMVGVFIPLIILSNGGTLWLVTLFYLTYSIVKLSINYVAMIFIQTRGAHIGLGVGFIFGALQLLAILGYSLTHHPLLLILGAVGLAFTNGFIWNAQHSFIAQVMSNSTKSSSIATMNIMGKVLGIIGPFIGGVIGGIWGADWLLISVLFIMLSTFFPLRHMRTLVSKQEAQPIRYTLSGAPTRDIVANFCFNIETTIGIMFWPIYLAVAISNYGSIGIIATTAAIAAVASTWLAGHRGDKSKDRSVLRQGVTLVSLTNILRIFAHSPFTIAAVGALYQSSLSYMQNSWTSTYYHHAKKKGVQYIVSMEIACDLAYIFVWSTLLSTVLIFQDVQVFFVSAFVIAAIAAWGSLLITRQKE